MFKTPSLQTLLQTQGKQCEVIRSGNNIHSIIQIQYVTGQTAAAFYASQWHCL